MTLDPCPYCMSETMIRKMNAWNREHDECLDCGYVREIKRKPKEAA
jgi:Zn ribbon nucleic-acid-binding protein